MKEIARSWRDLVISYSGRLKGRQPYVGLLSGRTRIIIITVVVMVVVASHGCYNSVPRQ
jgi:hypothetical protein